MVLVLVNMIYAHILGPLYMIMTSEIQLAPHKYESHLTGTYPLHIVFLSAVLRTEWLLFSLVQFPWRQHPEWPACGRRAVRAEFKALPRWTATPWSPPCMPENNGTPALQLSRTKGLEELYLFWPNSRIPQLQNSGGKTTQCEYSWFRSQKERGHFAKH